MHKISKLVVKRKYQLVFGCLFFFGFMFVFNMSGNSKVYADCGADGVGPHGYAGAIIDVVIRRSDGSQVEARGISVIITTLQPSSTGANTYNLNNGSRVTNAKFTQIQNNCSSNGIGNLNVVFGYGNTSQLATGAQTGGQWSLDCDRSLHPSFSQRFRVTANDVPSNARSGGNWTSEEIAPSNGTTARTTIYYNEPAGNEPIPLNDRVDVNSADCSSANVTVYDRNGGGVSYRIYYTDGAGNHLFGAWLNSGVTGSRNISYAGGASLGTYPSRVFVQVLQQSNNAYNTPPNSIYEPLPRAGQPCNPGNTLVNLNLTGSCTAVGIRGLWDSDVPGGVAYNWAVYERGAAGDQQGLIAEGYGVGSGDFDVPFNPVEANGVNNGYIMVVSANDRNEVGDSVGSITRTFGTGPCYVATCTTSIVANVPGGAAGNAVQAGQQFTLNYNINETGQLRVPDGSISLTSQPVAGWPGLGALTPHIGRNGPITLTAPDTVNSFTINFYPDWWGLFPVGVPSSYVCPITIDVYKPYDIEPVATQISLDPDNENPSRVNFTSATIKHNPAGITVPNINATRVITKNGAAYAGSTFTAPPNYRAGNPSDTRQFIDTANTVQPNNGGDAYCGYITVAPAAGWIGPNDKRTVTVASATDGIQRCNPANPGDPSDPGGNCAGGICPPTERIVNQPYVKSYGGDIAASGGFITASGNCTATAPKGIFAYMRPLSENNPATNKSGSGSQLAAFAWGDSGEVSGFTTANLRNSPPLATQGNGLTFGNAGASPSQTGNEPKFGGKLRTNPVCLPNYYEDTQYPAGNANRINGTTNEVQTADLASTANNKQTVFDTSGSRITVRGTNTYSARHTVYVNGDVAIAGNIIYNAASYGGDIKAIPNFTLVVRGNIYVDRSVTQLDGTYIAQPIEGNANTGKIYTCSSGFNALTSASDMFEQCGAAGGVERLRVNGSFIADQVVLNRTMNSLRDSKFQEQSSASNAAEIFTFSPDVYLSPPVFRPNSTITSGDYQYIATLPPIL